MCNRLDLQALGSQPVVLKNLPDQWMTSVKVVSWLGNMTLCKKLQQLQ